MNFRGARKAVKLITSPEIHTPEPSRSVLGALSYIHDIRANKAPMAEEKRHVERFFVIEADGRAKCGQFRVRATFRLR